MNRIIKLSFIAIITILVLIALHYISWFKPAESLLVRSLGVVQGKIYNITIGISSLKQSWLTKRDLLAENKKLIAELKESKLNQSQISILEQENELLKKELNFIDEHQLNFVSARIITGVSDPLSQSVIINRGTRDGIGEGMAVVADDGILVGKIYEVSDGYSKVLLLTDNQSKVAVTILNYDQTVGLVEGQFGLSLAMTNIPQDEEINEGDLIVTSGLEGKIPKNLLIAQVESVSQTESDIFKTAVLTPIIPFDNLSYVVVIIP
ncbi:MAG TPA: rod shape-determining protein MreC [Patescibacteria group bacterium]|nr:rod shape-determining protein MreC [Patescibacteria group bacterium]